MKAQRDAYITRTKLFIQRQSPMTLGDNPSDLLGSGSETRRPALQDGACTGYIIDVLNLRTEQVPYLYLPYLYFARF